MPRYNINGVWHYSDTELSPEDLDALDKSSTPKPATPAVQPEKDTSLWGRAKSTIGDIASSPITQRLLFGEAKGDQEQSKQNILSNIDDPALKAKLAASPTTGKLVGGPQNEASILPNIKQPETYWGGFGKSLYDDFVKPLGTPSGFLGAMSPVGNPLSHQAGQDVLSAVDRGLPVNPAPVNIDSLAVHGPRNAPLGLPPAPPDIANARPTTFYQGPAGTTQAGKTYPIDIAPQSPRLGQIDQIPSPGSKGTLPVTVLPRETEGLSNLDPITAANRGTKFGDIQSIDTSSPQGALRSNAKAISGEPIQLPKQPVEDIGNIGKPNLPYQLESAPVQLKTKPQGFDATGAESGLPKTPTAPKSNGLVENYANKGYSSDTPVKDVVKSWADGTRGATYRGNLAAEKFADLTDPKLIDAFESGDRSGRLKDLESYFEAKHKQGVQAGLFKDDQKVLNYIRHEYDNSEEEIRAAMKNYVPEKSSISKTRGFPTYAEAEKSGLTRKYQTIPELVNAYETKFNQALKNKEFYDYLKDTKQVTGILSDKPENWTFKGPNAPVLKKLVSNVLGQSPEGLKTAADAASVTKNIYLSGGIPGTKYNMHQWNIAKNDMALNGYWSGLKKLFTDPTGNDAVKWMKALPDEEKNTLADLVDKGWQGHPMSDTGKDVNFFSRNAEKVGKETAAGRVLDASGKVLDLGQHAFEDPLFKRALPALGAQRTLEAFHKLEPELGRENALKAAAQIGNNFYGGVDTVLRNPVNKDLSRIAFLAPNWMESQLTKAVNQWKGAGKVLAGKGTPVDKIYAKSLARGATLPAIGAITGGAVLSKRGGDIGAIHMGQDEQGKDRTFPTLTTASEEYRLPITAPIQMYMGNPAALKDLLIKNRISTPAKTVMNLVKGEDDLGNPLANKDKYGRDISFGKGLANYAVEASKPLQHQAVQALVGYLQGKMSREEAISKGLELPMSYSKPAQ